jgi:hypothetical protein
MAHAADAFNDALACWTGDPLSELTRFSFHDTSARSLREFRFEIVERRNDGYLACGRHAEVLRDIELWIAHEPWRERLRSQQMLAYYYAGRQIEALAIYDDVRALLLDGFGVDPSQELQDLHGSILRQELTSAHDPREETALIYQLSPFADCSSVFVVDGRPEVNATWIVGELSTTRIPRGMPRVALADFVAAMNAPLEDQRELKRAQRLAR